MKSNLRLDLGLSIPGKCFLGQAVVWLETDKPPIDDKTYWSLRSKNKTDHSDAKEALKPLPNPDILANLADFTVTRIQ